MMVNTWHGSLGHYDLDTLKLAAHRTIATCKFPPTVADINNALKELVLLGLPTAGEAWETLQRELHDPKTEDCWVAYRRADGWVDHKFFDNATEAMEFAGARGEVYQHTRRSKKESYVEKGSILERTIEVLGGLDTFENAEIEGVERAKFFEVYNEFRSRAATLAITPSVVRQKALLLASNQTKALMGQVTKEGETDVGHAS